MEVGKLGPSDYFGKCLNMLPLHKMLLGFSKTMLMTGSFDTNFSHVCTSYRKKQITLHASVLVGRCE